MKLKEVIKTHTQKDGTEWSWIETDELLQALKMLNELVPVSQPPPTP